MRIAAFDIGSNSVRCTVVEAPADGPRVVLDDDKAYTRLGAGLASTGKLSAEAVDETITALRRMLEVARRFEVTHTRAVATAAVRNARNGATLVERARVELGLQIEVVSEAEEGRLAFLSAHEGLGIVGRIAVADLGGGSLELVRATDAEIEAIVSMPLGAVLLTEQYHRVDPIPPEDLKRLVKHVRRTLRDALGEESAPAMTLVGSGGTANALAALIAARRDPGLSHLHGYTVRRAEVAHLLAQLSRSTAAQRAAMKAMPENRVDIIVAGAVVFDEVMRALGANEFVINARGMRDGVVIDTVQRERGQAAPPDREKAVMDFVRRCDAEEGHAYAVRDFAVSLFDELCDEIDVDADTRPLLEAAALMHDVGYHIAYDDHHKHSYHLISYAELPGFSGRELRLIAGIARYHRGALPKASHEAMLNLSADDRALVAALGSLVKVADGLDRTRSQRITRVKARVDGPEIVISIKGEGPLDVEVYGAQRKTDLLERVTGRRVTVCRG